MYRITTNGNRALWDPSAGITLIDPKLELKLNGAGSLTFKIDPTHHLYGTLSKYTSYIDITHDGEWLWSGRVLNTTTDMNNFITVEAEGEQAYLNDIIQRPKEYHNISIRNYLIDVVENIYNPQVPIERRFKIGIVTVTDSNDSIYKISNYDNTWDLLNDRLLGTFGGYFRIRHENGVKYIDYLKDFTGISTQHIAYGDNLLDLVLSVRGEDFATAVIPLGEQDPDTDTRLTIASVNGGRDYVQDDELVAEYGLILKVVEHDDVTLPSNLLAKGLKDLAQCNVFNGVIETRAIDLNIIDSSVESFRLGDLVTMDSKPHSLEVELLLREIKLPFDNPQNLEFILGTEFKTLTDSKLHADKVINEIKADYVTNQQLQNTNENITKVSQAVQTNTSAIEQLPTSILAEVESEYSKVTSVDYIQALIDGTACKWAGTGIPTVNPNTGMYLAIPRTIPFTLRLWGNWNEGETNSDHIGDIYTDNATGKKYVFRTIDGDDGPAFIWEYLEENAYVYDVARLNMKSDSIALSVNKLSSDIGRQSAEIVMMSDRITSKVTKGSVVSEINQTSEEIRLTGNRVVIQSTHFSVTTDGHISATGGTIGGFVIGSSSLANNTSRLNYLGESGITPGDYPDECVYVGTDGISLGKNAKIRNNGVAYFQEIVSTGRFEGISGVTNGHPGVITTRINKSSIFIDFVADNPSNPNTSGGIFYQDRSYSSARGVGLAFKGSWGQFGTLIAENSFYLAGKYYVPDSSGYLHSL